MSKKNKQELEMLPIRSVKHYFNEFLVEGLKGKTSVQEIDILSIKGKILDAFRKEIFGQIVFKLGPETMEMELDDLADMEGIQNILENGFRKWRRFCILCNENGLGTYFHLEDLKDSLEQRIMKEPDPDVVVPDVEEDVTDKLNEILPEGEEPVYLNGGVQILPEEAEIDGANENSGAV